MALDDTTSTAMPRARLMRAAYSIDVSVTRWEYTFEEQPIRRLPDLIKDLNEDGDEGWEAFAAMSVGVSTGTVTVLLKRPLP